jgi:hypothetical protein
MKMTIEIDCSPDEARRFMGLPDVERVNSAYLDAMSTAMKGATSFDQIESYAKQVAPMGQFGLNIFKSFIEGAQQAAVGATTLTKDDKQA